MTWNDPTQFHYSLHHAVAVGSTVFPVGTSLSHNAGNANIPAWITDKQYFVNLQCTVVGCSLHMEVNRVQISDNFNMVWLSIENFRHYKYVQNFAVMIRDPPFSGSPRIPFSCLQSTA